MNKNNKRYSCYKHSPQRKQAKDSTNLYNHVPLGVINPIHSHPNLPQKLQIQGLSIQSKPFRIQKQEKTQNSRNHDYNEIQHRQTLPQRLIKPRVYIQKIIGKKIPYKPFLGLRNTGAQQFENLIYLYSKIGKTVKDRKQLEVQVKDFLIQKFIDVKEKDSLLTREIFICFLIGRFYFSEEDAQLFWQIAYNDKRFKKKDSISMQAFTYNFEKCYLQTLQKYKNMFSQSALRQRLIDIRVLLHNWKKNNIYLKQNLRQQTGKQLDICLFLKKNISEQLFAKFTQQLQKRNRTHFYLRSLAKCVYHLTDDKYLTYDKVKNRVIQNISQKSNILKLSQNIIQKFVQTKQIQEQHQFPITQILQFIHLQGINQEQMELLMKWLRGIYQLKFNRQTLKLQCSQLIKVNLQFIRQYQGYIKNQCDDFVNILGQLMQQTDNIISLMPQVSGPKKTILQCNYIAQNLLRYINKIQFLPFYKIFKIIQIYQTDQNNVGKYEKVFSQNNIKKQIIQRNMKPLWTFHQSFDIQKNQIPINNKSNYQSVMKDYHEISKGIKSQKKKQIIKSNKYETQKNYTQSQKQFSSSNQKVKEIQSIFEIPEQCKRQKVVNSIDYKSQLYCNVPQQIRQSISTVQGLQSHLMDLLNM